MAPSEGDDPAGQTWNLQPTGVMQANRYRQIQDYGMIGDCRSCALISSDGSIDWACFPDFDSPSVFAKLLDVKKGGSFQIHPGRPSRKDRAYLDDTNVLKTSFRNEEGQLDLIDFMPIFTPEGQRSSSLIVRIVECPLGRMDVEVEFDPRFRYGRNKARLSGIKHSAGKTGQQWIAAGPEESLSLQADGPFKSMNGRLKATFRMKEGERRYFVLEYHPKADPDTLHRAPEDISAMFDQTVQYWREWAGCCKYDGPYRSEVVRSALILKALTHDPTGGIIAAATTSLPEEIGGTRNWDYRYVWLRDAAFVVQALVEVGHIDDAERFVDWICAASGINGEELGVVYRLDGTRNIEERTLEHLEGYRRSTPVRVGNGASEQHQLDVYGDVMDCVELVRKHGNNPEKARWNHFRKLVDWVCDHWHRPGKGIWEIRSEDRNFIHSIVMAWVALDRALRAVEELDMNADLKRWRRTKEEIHAWVMKHGWDERLQSFVHAAGYPWLDAANLRLSLVGFIPATHPRMRATIDRTIEILSKDGFVYRYLEVEDGLPGGEGTFTICSFWLVSALVQLGRIEEAHESFRNIVRASNDLGLFAEEMDPVTREHLGNFPQAFTHVGLITAAFALREAERNGKVERLSTDAA